VGEQRELLLAVTIPERPGSFLQFCETLGRRGITEFNYRYFDAAAAQVFLGVEITGSESDRESLMQPLRQAGYGVVNMTGNELAIEHIRYMVGGHAPCLLDEVVYSFEFPERPGALLKFLSVMGGRWNISLFHYRNHGAAYGRVLMGLQVPPAERQQLRDFLESMTFAWRDETENPAYRMFVGGNEGGVSR
jgi:threonine dehydratase